MILSTTVTATAKKGSAGIMGALAALGVTPADGSLFMAIFIGLVGGTLAAWARERQGGHEAGWRWAAMQAAAWLMIFVLVTALHDYPGLTVRWAAAMAALCSFASREGLNAMQRRVIREIEERPLP